MAGNLTYLALVALNLLVSLITRLVACSARIVADKQTNKQTHRTTTVTLAAHARRGLMTALTCIQAMSLDTHTVVS